MFSTPILLITFNRPYHVRNVLKEIRKQLPMQLYIFQDGAREGNTLDAERVQEVRDVIKELVDWPCKLYTLYQEKNLGCGLGPSAAITWFFEQVEMGIILEDDCIPHPHFFSYCEELLIKYQFNTEISIVGGCNHNLPVDGDASYTFMGGHHQTWGWASWRRTWKHFDYYLSQFDEKIFRNCIKYYYRDLRQQLYWDEIYKMVKKNRMEDSCWDYQFYFSYWKNRQLAICPNVNLVTNAGCGEDATHTNSDDNVLLNVKTVGIMPLKHPTNIEYSRHIDDYMMKRYIIPYEYGISGLLRLPYLINRLIKRLLNHHGSWIKRRNLK